MMRPCIGIDGLCPPLCKWADLEDGTYSIAHVMRFHIAMDELLAAREAARNAS